MLDPKLASARIVGPLLALAGAVAAPAISRWRWPALVLGLAAGCSIAAFAEPEFRADAPGYYAYLRSLFFDHDLDFTNEMNAWGLSDTSSLAPGLRHDRNPYSIGPAMIWSPFFLIGHGYALLRGHAPNGFTEPYYRSLALGTVVVGLFGAWLLAQTLEARFGRSIALLAIAAVLTASPALYYLFVLPGVSHGLAFGLACATVWALDLATRRSAEWHWYLLGGLFGLLVLVRWQAAVYALALLVIAVHGLFRQRVRATTLLVAAAIAVAMFLPQVVVWRHLYGAFITVPQGSGFFLSGPSRWVDVLLHADHGLFVWTPALLLAALGLAASLKDHPILATSGWLIFGATVALNGSLRDWAGSDAFGSRRFDVVLPFFALGFCSLFARLVGMRWLAPVVLVVVFASWNLGMMAGFRSGFFSTSASVESIGIVQSRVLRASTESVLGALAGRRGRAFAYKALVGEYLYYNLFLDGKLDIASLPDRFLAGGWSAPRPRATPPFRWANYPAACLRLPLEWPMDLHGSLLVRAPDTLQEQVVSIAVNGQLVATHRFTPDWREAAFVIPEDTLAPGNNILCLRFARPAPGDDASPLAAAVSRIQFP